MSGIIISWLLILLLVLLLVTAVSCQQQPTPLPTTPATQPVPTPEPSPPPSPLAEVPHYEITVLLFEGFTLGFETGHELLEFRGEIRNDSQAILEDMEAVITVYDKNGNVQGTDFRRIHNRVLYPSKTSVFRVIMDDYVNGVSAKLSFQLSAPGMLELQLGRDVPDTLWKPVLSAAEKEEMIREGRTIPEVVKWKRRSP